jgi:hypothetical protein
VKLQLKAVLLGLTGTAIVLVMLGSLALSLDERLRSAHRRMDVRTQRLTSAGVPLCSTRSWWAISPAPSKPSTT